MTTVEHSHGPAVMSGRDGLRWLRSRLRLRPGRTLVGVDGLAGAGKTSFARELATLVSECGIGTVQISLDAYGVTPNTAHRRVPSDGDESIPALSAFVDDVLEPLGRTGSGRYRLPCRDESDHVRWEYVAEDAVVIVEGMYLHCPPLTGEGGQRTWDLSVWLDVPIEQAYLRLHRERGIDPDPHAKANAHSYRAQLDYIKQCDPIGRADLIVDNSSPHASID